MKIMNASAFSSIKPDDFIIEALNSELNTTFSDMEIGDNQLSGGQNIISASDTSLKKRAGISLFGPLLGNLPITGGFNFVNQAGVQRQLVCYNTGVNIHTSTTSTPISGITLAQGTICDGIYFPFTDKFYIVNGTNNVAKILNDGTGDQSDGSFKKGKYITTFQNRLLVTGTGDQRIWYTDSQVDTFSGTNWFELSGEPTAIITFYSKVLIFTKRKIYRLENFTFDGTNSWVNNLFELPVEFGAIIEGTVKIVNGYVFFIGQDMNNVAAIYMCDGYTAQNITDTKILNTMRGLSGSKLNSSCAASDGFSYRIAVAESGKGTNNINIIYDTVKQKFLPIERRFIEGMPSFSCMWSSETNGVWSVYAGDQNIGQVFQLHTNDGLFDETPEERYLVTGNKGLPFEEITDLRVAESFKMSQYNNTISVPITQVAAMIATNGGTPGNFIMRIETDNGGVPSGILVNPNATTTVSSTLVTASYSYVMGIFSVPFNVTGSTIYWLVLMHPAGTTNSKYLALANTSGNYANGNAATYAKTISTSTQNFSPNATPESTSVDGFVANIASTSFSSIRSSSGDSSDHTTQSIYVSLNADNSTNLYDYLSRAVVLFDTSSLPIDAVISSATLSLYVFRNVDSFSQSIGITSSSPNSNITLNSADYNLANFGSTRFSTDKTIPSLTNNAYNNFSLNASGISAINLTGITKFAVRLSADIDNSAPTWSANNISQVGFWSSEAGTSKQPKLSVTYTSASGSAVWTSLAGTNLDFAVYAQSPIDAYADTKSFLPVEGKEMKMIKFQPIFSSAGNYFCEIGFEIANTTGSFKTYLVNLGGIGTAGKWDDNVSKWDDGITIWDGAPSRSFNWTDIGSFVNRSVKLRIRNRNANQQFEFNKINAKILPRLRNV